MNCPSNVGIGMRASLMLRLAGLAREARSTKLGIMVRGPGLHVAALLGEELRRLRHEVPGVGVEPVGSVDHASSFGCPYVCHTPPVREPGRHKLPLLPQAT